MFESIGNRWVSLSIAGRVILIAIIVALMLAFIYLASWVMKEDYQVLFSELNPQDASSMVAELERNKTPYKLADNGTSILVENDAVYKTRLKLVGKGLNLNGSVGFEIFNNSEFGMTEFAQKVNYLRALQGELERTIMGFDEIKSARVHLVLPESGLFKRKDAIPKASVTVSVRDNAQLTAEQVLGIQKLVSASVPVTTSEVTVVDQRGLALTKNIAGNDGDASISQRLDIKKQFENYMTQKLVNVLDRVVGQGKAIVSVDISLNYDQVKTTKEDIIPLPHTKGQSVGAITRKRTTHQVDELEGGQIASFNEDQEPASSNAPSSSSMSEVEYTNNRRVEQILSSPGAVNKLSVGVFVPNINDSIKLAKIKEIVSMTAGISVSRGDGIVVHDIEIPTFAEVPVSKIDDGSLVEMAPAISHMQKVKNANYNLTFWHYLLFGSLLILAALYFLVWKKVKVNNSSLTDDRADLLAQINSWAEVQRTTKL